MTAIAERVARGAALLDEKQPGWHQRIDLGELNISDTCRCVLGQLWGTKRHGYYSPFGAMATTLHIFPLTPALGFEGFDDEESRRLTAAWRELIESRRAAP